MASLLAAAMLVLIRPSAAASGASGAVKLFSDNGCNQAIKSITSISLNACFNTGEAVAISVTGFPLCADGQATLYISDQKQCGRPSIQPMSSTSMVGECLSLPFGNDIESAAFQCPSSGDTATSTSTGPSSAAVPKESQVSDTQPATSLFSAMSTSTEVPLATATTAPTKGGGLDESDKIGIAVGLSLGIAGLIIAMITLKYTRQAAVNMGEPPPAYSRYPSHRC